MFEEPAQDGEHPQHEQHVMYQGENCAHAVPVSLWHPAEGVPDVQQDAHRGHQNGVEGGAHRFPGDNRRDRVELHLVPLQAKVFFQVFQDAFPLRLLVTGGFLQHPGADQEVAGPHSLDQRLVVSQPVQPVLHLCLGHWPVKRHLQRRPAGEVDSRPQPGAAIGPPAGGRDH